MLTFNLIFFNVKINAPFDFFFSWKAVNSHIVSLSYALINSLHDKVKRRGLRSVKVAKVIQSEGKSHDAYKSNR